MNNVIQAMLDRRSCRSYRAEQIKEEELQQILLAGGLLNYTKEGGQ